MSLVRGKMSLPLVPDRLRPWVLAVTVVALACLAGFGFYVKGSSRAVLFDHSADAFLARSSGPAYRVAVILSDCGDPRIFATVTVVIAVSLALLGDFRAAIAAVGTVVVGLVVVEEVLKPFFGRHLGDLPGPTFPSGHTTVAVALASAVMLAARGSRPLGQLLGPALRYVLVVLAAVVSLCIGLAMVVRQLHYMSDVVAGVPLGLAVTGCTAALVDGLASFQASRRRTAR